MKRHVWLLLTCLLASGCGGVADVKGTVTYKGALLKFGSVTAIPPNGMLVQDNIKEDGSFELKGVALGEAKILVYAQDPKFVKVVTDIAMKAKTFKGEGGGGRAAAGALNTGEAVEALKNPNTVPDKYMDEKTSPLKFTVKRGENSFNIVLTD